MHTNGFKYCNLTIIVLFAQSYVVSSIAMKKTKQIHQISNRCLHTVKGLNNFICLIDGNLTGTTFLGPGGPGSNENEEVLHIP